MAKNLPFSKDQIAKANHIDLIEFAKSHGYTLKSGGRRALHAKQSGGLYFFRDRNKYHHFSTDTSGGPIDFVMQFMGMDFKEAVAYLLETSIPLRTPLTVPQERGELILPAKAPNYRRVAWYLIHARGIDPEIISHLMHEKKLYQQDKTGSCVFIGYDQDGNAKYCSMRGTNLNSSFKQDQKFSDKSYPFHIVGYQNSTRVYVCESPIDAMSRATIEVFQGRDWRVAHYISLGCLSDQALERFLHYNQMSVIVFCLDNDANDVYNDGNYTPNWGQEAAIKFAGKYRDFNYETFIETPKSKDFNEDLTTLQLSLKCRMNETDHGYEQ
ncbi:DUF3991 domain-containing protein [Xylanibacillus composti]|uniref:DUF3991 domain-containing protein n=1 Tax=Xylanibacillus composti TaxID=1572762 RepID=A0A8J4M1S1_9BACL|nr:DUF3991 domain-containing protein [Xylanibacillus composti]GIQ68360.1 hypothetical protein XYCOK13_11840 [Xylanibacillus composti]